MACVCSTSSMSVSACVGFASEKVVVVRWAFDSSGPTHAQASVCIIVPISAMRSTDTYTRQAHPPTHPPTLDLTPLLPSFLTHPLPPRNDLVAVAGDLEALAALVHADHGDVGQPHLVHRLPDPPRHPAQVWVGCHTGMGDGRGQEQQQPQQRRLKEYIADDDPGETNKRTKHNTQRSIVAPGIKGMSAFPMETRAAVLFISPSKQDVKEGGTGHSSTHRSTSKDTTTPLRAAHIIILLSHSSSLIAAVFPPHPHATTHTPTQAA
jgi:hypothetical protein